LKKDIKCITNIKQLRIETVAKKFMILVDNKQIIAIRKVITKYMELEVDQDCVATKKIRTEFICAPIVEEACNEIALCIICIRMILNKY
jgi:hypothetical protein